MSLESPDPEPSFSLPTIPKMPKLSKQNGIIIAVVVLALIPSIYFYTKYTNAKSMLATNPSQLATDEAKNLVTTVSKLMNLPTDETPTVATVNDKEKLKNQPFFAKSENGDKVLIYTNAKKAILFRPSINKIIDVAPVNLGATASASAAPAEKKEVMPEMKFSILNGTDTAGLTKKYEQELKEEVITARIVDKDNAKRRTYETSLLIDVKGTRSTQAKALSEALNLELSPLPEGESTPSSDFLIILGSDRK